MRGCGAEICRSLKPKKEQFGMKSFHPAPLMSQRTFRYSELSPVICQIISTPRTSICCPNNLEICFSFVALPMSNLVFQCKFLVAFHTICQDLEVPYIRALILLIKLAPKHFMGFQSIWLPCVNIVNRKAHIRCAWEKFKILEKPQFLRNFLIPFLAQWCLVCLKL